MKTALTNLIKRGPVKVMLATLGATFLTYVYGVHTTFTTVICVVVTIVGIIPFAWVLKDGLIKGYTSYIGLGKPGDMKRYREWIGTPSDERPDEKDLLIADKQNTKVVVSALTLVLSVMFFWTRMTVNPLDISYVQTMFIVSFVASWLYVSLEARKDDWDGVLVTRNVNIKIKVPNINRSLLTPVAIVFLDIILLYLYKTIAPHVLTSDTLVASHSVGNMVAELYRFGQLLFVVGTVFHGFIGLLAWVLYSTRKAVYQIESIFGGVILLVLFLTTIPVVNLSTVPGLAIPSAAILVSTVAVGIYWLRSRFSLATFVKHLD